MRVIGIDPGSVVCGYGVVEKEGSKLLLVEYGVIEAKKMHSHLSLRLKEIYERITKVIERTLPDEASLEATFYSKNAQSLIKLSHARAVALLAATMRELPVIEYSAKEIKKSVTGNGNASKEQVQYMTKSILNISETPEFFDATDALATAICHIQKAQQKSSRPKSWKDFVEQNPNRIFKQ